MNAAPHARLAGEHDVRDVPWDTLEDLDGPATAMADLLVQAFDPSPEEAVDAVDDIADRVDTTVGTAVVASGPDRLTSCVPALLPFLVRLASDRDRPARVREVTMHLVVDLAALAHRVRPEHLDAAWPGAWADQRSRIDALLADPLPSVVLHAVEALSREPGTAARLLRVLRDRWEAVGDGHAHPNPHPTAHAAEGPDPADPHTDPADVAHTPAPAPAPDADPGEDPGEGADPAAHPGADRRRTRLRLLARAVRLHAAHPDSVPPEVLAWLLDRREHGDLDERMVVAFASPALVPEDPLPLVLEGIVGDDARPVTGRPLWTQVAHLTPGSDALLVRHGLCFVAEALAEDRAARERIVEALIGHPRASVRLGAVRLAHDLAAEYRSGGERWAGPVGGTLEDPDPDVRVWSLRLLALAGNAARPHADRLAAYVARDEAGATTALLSLALLGDPRAAALLVERSDRPGHGFVRRRPHDPRPGLEDVLGRLAAHADLLVPHLRERLRGGGDADGADADGADTAGTPGAEVTRVTGDSEDTAALLRALEAWGPAAAPLADDVAALLDRPALRVAALRVLAATGPAALAHADRVLSLAGEADAVAVAHAHLRLTGDAEAALALLGPDGPAEWDDAACTLLDEIGPPAAPHAAALRLRLERRLGQDLLRDTPALSALWSLTGDTGFVLRVLLSPRQRVLTAGAATRSGLPAVRLLGRIGPDAAGALPLLRSLRDSERSAWPGWTTMDWRAAERDRRLVAEAGQAVRRIEGRPGAAGRV